MGVKERRERERADVREKILDAALEFFAAKGVEGVTMRALAEAIEYSTPVIYSHFRDKDALIHELCFRALRGLSNAFAAIGEIDDPIERIRRTGRAYVDFALENPSHFQFLFLTSHASKSQLEDELVKGDPQQDAYAFLVLAMREAMNAGCFKAEFTDPEELAQICWASAHGVVALQVVKQDHKWVEWRDARETSYRLIDAALSGLTGRDLLSPPLADTHSTATQG